MSRKGICQEREKSENVTIRSGTVPSPVILDTQVTRNELLHALERNSNMGDHAYTQEEPRESRQESSIGNSEDSLEFIVHHRHHVAQGQGINEEPWPKEEIVRALSKLPAGGEIYSLLSSLDDEALEKLLEEGGEVERKELAVGRNTVGSNGNSPAGMELLRKWPNTALLIASYLGKVDLMKALLKHDGAAEMACTARDADGRTGLHLAACAASLRGMEVLLASGANPGEWDSERMYTPLHCAAAIPEINCVDLLIKSGADVNAGLCGRSPLHYAVLRDAADCVEALLAAGASPNNPQVYTETPLHVAASLGSASCVSLLLKHGADVRVQYGDTRSTPLHLAAEEGSAECTRLLLEAGASQEARNLRGQTALHLAALSQSCETVNVLLRNGSKVNSEDGDGRTALHAAVAKCTRGTELVKTLIEAGAEVNKPDRFGYTPVHIAALNESSDMVTLLLSKGADVTARTKGGVSALSFIVRRTPDVLGRFLAHLDQAISLHDRELGDVDCELRLDFGALVPGGRCETELMLCLVEVDQRQILRHPLCESFLYLKWLRVRKFFLLSLLFHSIFVAVFTSYIAVAYLWTLEAMRRIIFWPVITFIMVLVGKELFQMVHGLSSYAKRWENWLQWGVVLVSSLALIAPINQWQYHAAALGILLIWIELMIVVGRFPMFGLYIQMFAQVSINFFKFLAAYICLIVGFSLGFSVLHKNYKSFMNPLVSLLKTIIMMSGELEFEDVFFDKESPILYPGTAHLMLLSFVILVTVILTNLMVGLAVSDIQELRRSAGLDRLVRRAELVAHLEGMLFSRLLDYAPTRIVEACRRGALLLRPPHHCSIHIRPNDPRESRLPRELIRAIYRLVSNRKSRSGTLTAHRFSALSNGRNNGRARTISTSVESNQQQINELTTELRKCSYNIRTRLDNLTSKLENIARDINLTMQL